MGFLVRRYAGRDSEHYGANAVGPAFGDSPPDCRMESFESLRRKQNPGPSVRKVLDFGTGVLIGLSKKTSFP